MSKYQMSVKMTRPNTNVTSSYLADVQLPDHLDLKIGNSNFKQEIINALYTNLPQKLSGNDWRKSGYIILSFNVQRKL